MFILRISVLMLLMSGSAWVHANADTLYAQALSSVEQENYSEALAQLRQLQRNYPTFKQMAAVQTRMAVLQEAADAGGSLPVFLNALTLRDQGQVMEALAELNVIAQAYPAGALTDDALYITAYLQVMDRYDYAAAREALVTLQQRFPESAYADSALYLDAIAMEQQGDTESAKLALIELRDKHTALSLPLGFRWPVGTILSRYWFDRADRRLAIVQARIASASAVLNEHVMDDGKLRVAVNVDGADIHLLLSPSPMTQATVWLDAAMDNQLPPAVGVFDGTVEGVEVSWVRAVLRNGSIRGVVNIDGVQSQLTPSNLIGTLDYYQPRSRKRNIDGGLHSDLADSVQGLDVLVAPPAPASDFTSRSVTVQSDVRTVPVSIVVDSQYDRYYAGEGLIHALNNLNVADGVYRDFGFALSLDEAVQFSEVDDPLLTSAVPLETILRSFRNYRMQYSTVFKDSAVSYLFTGNQRTDVTLGLAWIDTACRTDGYDVGVTTPSSFGDVLLTHELGHSFGAQHDSDTQCNDNRLSVMWPNISDKTTTEFTHCARESVSGAHAKSCLVNSIDLSLYAYSSGNTVSFTVFNADSSLDVDAQLAVETSSPNQLQWPEQCFGQTPTSAICNLEAVEGGESRTIDFPVSSAFASSDALVTAQVSPTAVLELSNENNEATISLLAGSSSGNLPSNESPLAEADSSTSEGVVQTPVTGAAKSGGAPSYLLLGLLGLMALRWYRTGKLPVQTTKELAGSY